MSSDLNTQLPTAGFLRRVGAFLYDILLLMAIIVIAGFVALPFTGGEAPSPGNPFYQTYLFVICYIFFAWFWTRGGQTLGMRAWRLRVQNEDGSTINLSQALLRFMAGIATSILLGIGIYLLKSEPMSVRFIGGVAALILLLLSFLWIFIDKKKLAWHDHFSSCKVVELPKLKK